MQPKETASIPGEEAQSGDPPDVSRMLAARGRFRSRSKFCLLLMWSLTIAWFPFAAATPGTIGQSLSRLLPLGIVASMVAGVIFRYRAGWLEDSLAKAIGSRSDIPALVPGDYVLGFWVRQSESGLRMERDGGLLALLRIHGFLGFWVLFFGLFAIILVMGAPADRWYAIPFFAVFVCGALWIVWPKVIALEIGIDPIPTFSRRRVVLGCLPRWTQRCEIVGFSRSKRLRIELVLEGGRTYQLCAEAGSPSAVWDALRLTRTLEELGIGAAESHPTNDHPGRQS